MWSNNSQKATHYLRVLLDLLDLRLELIDLTLVGSMWHGQVVHGEGPEGGVELRAEIIPDPGWMERYHSFMHRCHHLFAGRHVLVHLLLLPITFFCFLQLIILRLHEESMKLKDPEFFQVNKQYPFLSLSNSSKKNETKFVNRQI